MPLPVGTEKLAWPPRAVVDHYRQVAFDAAWWAGEPAGLALAHSTTTSQPTSFTDVPDTGRLRFWSRRSRDASGASRSQLHVPMAADLATTSADLLFGQPPALTGSDRLAELVDLAGLPNIWLEGAETAAALSGVYLRPGWDKDAADWPFLTVVQPDDAVPEWRSGQLVAITFWTVLPSTGGSTVWRHLERHDLQGGTWHLEHGLYAGGKDTLGVRQPNAGHPGTEHLQDVPYDTGVPFLGVAYVPNMRPNRTDRHSPMGRSDYSGGVTGLMDALDEAWTSWVLELRLARARIIVPETYLDTKGPGTGQTFDYDREVFTPIAVPAAPGQGDQLTMTAFPIRAEQHQATCLALVERIVTSAGYSPQDFGLQIEGRAESGTALRLRRGRSVATTAKKQRYWQPALARTSLALLWLDKSVFGFKGEGIPEAVPVEWQEEIDLPERATTVDLINRAQAASIDAKVRLLHPEWSDTEVATEAAAIKAEQGMLVPDPLQMGDLA